jgi:uncharacterized membrane protein
MSTDFRLRVATVVVASIGLVDSAYLTWIKLTHNEASCIKGIGDCQTVNTSPYSEIHGVPIALLGGLAYLALLALVLFEAGGVIHPENTRLGIFGIALTGSLYSAYLTYLEIAVIRAICPFCVLSAISMVTIFVLAIVRLSRSQMTQIPRQEEN